MNDDKTLDYYNHNAEKFISSTLNVSFIEVQNRFLSLLPEKAFILDFGCGSGRDTKYFLEKGFLVDATDSSEKLCRIASEFTGINVEMQRFSDLDAIEKYDGVWACASILHLPKAELANVFIKIVDATKSGGYIYASFKYGDSDFWGVISAIPEAEF